MITEPRTKPDDSRLIPITDLILEDLKRSGLSLEDMGVREAGAVELAACKLPETKYQGYVIPYTGIDGRPKPFYRIRLFNKPKQRYVQPANTTNYVYFGKDFKDKVFVDIPGIEEQVPVGLIHGVTVLWLSPIALNSIGSIVVTKSR